MSYLVPDVEADQDHTVVAQHPAELPEDAGHRMVGHMDHRPERDDAGDRAGRQVEVGHGADVEAQLWMVAQVSQMDSKAQSSTGIPTLDLNSRLVP
jgi:hypothetical protein